jgi:tetratricopeptide (TPR) repeat protein
VDDFSLVTRQLVLNDDVPRALKAAQLGVELYPEAAQPNLMYGLAQILNSEVARGEASLRKAASINPSGGASASGLNNIAYQLAGMGKTDHAITILKVAAVLYPKEANLQDSLGEFHLKKGNKAKALEHYKKALELNPEFPNASAAREIVKRLTSELGGQ